MSQTFLFLWREYRREKKRHVPTSLFLYINYRIGQTSNAQGLLCFNWDNSWHPLQVENRLPTNSRKLVKMTLSQLDSSREVGIEISPLRARPLLSPSPSWGGYSIHLPLHNTPVGVAKCVERPHPVLGDLEIRRSRVRVQTSHFGTLVESNQWL